MVNRQVRRLSPTPPIPAFPRRKASHDLIESVAQATMHCDRDLLEVSLAQVLQGFLDARRVTVHRVHADADGLWAQQRVSLGADGVVLSAPCREPAALRPLADRTDWQECVLLREAVHSNDPQAFGRLSVFPLIAGEAVTGFVEIELAGSLLPRVAGTIDALLRIFRNHLKLLDYGERDTLTGLLNRRTFDAGFHKLLAAEAGGGLWLGVVDIDHFKAVNDVYGHLFGDEVLLLVSQIMQRVFRGADRLYRFGGEEFVVVLPATDEGGAAIAFERLRAEIERHRFPQVGRVTVSLGYTRALPSDAAGAAVERADAALYYAKRTGRNRVHCWEALAAEGRVAPKETPAEVELF